MSSNCLLGHSALTVYFRFPLLLGHPPNIGGFSIASQMPGNPSPWFDPARLVGLLVLLHALAMSRLHWATAPTTNTSIIVWWFIGRRWA